MPAAARVSVATRTSRVLRLLALVAVLVSVTPAPAQAFELWSDEPGERSHSFNTTIKWTSLLSRAPGDTTLYPEEWSGASLWRLRLALDSRPTPDARIDIAYELRSRIESDDDGAGGALVLPPTLPAPYRIEQLDADVIDARDGLSLRHELDRASFNRTFGSADITVGRQAVGWGRGLLFSVVDIFAPFSPLESDREWRRGIDAIRFGMPLKGLSSMDAVYAFGESQEESAAVVRISGYVGDIDGEFIGGTRRSDRVYAAALSMPLFDAEVHGEFGVFMEEADDAVAKALIGGSRTFDILRGLYVVAEYHYSGYGVEDVTDMDELAESEFVNRYTSGDTQMLGRHAVAVQLSYGFAGVTPVSVTWISSPVDGSGVIIPAVNWSFSDSVTLSAQGYFAHGSDSQDGALRSEYGATPAGVLAAISFYY